MPVLSLENVSKHFDTASGRLDVLDQITLEVGFGEVVACIGPSGCGKTTLLRIAASLELPSGGAIHLASPQDDGQAAVGFVFQEPTLLPWRSLSENVRLPAELSGREVRNTHEFVATLAAVGLEGFADYLPHQLSGGMKARAALARALVVEPKPTILLLDEAFAATDELTRSSLQKLLSQLLDSEQVACLLVTHSILEASLLAERIVVLSRLPATILDVCEVPLSREERLRDPDNACLADVRRHLRDVLANGVEKGVYEGDIKKGDPNCDA